MKLYPEACLTYIGQSGRVRTPASRASTIHHLRKLQSLHPTLSVQQFAEKHLIAYCYSGQPAPKTIMARRAQLRSFFDWAHFAGIVKSNPSSRLKYAVNPANVYVRTHTWLSKEQMALVLNSSDTTVQGRRDRLIVMLAGLTGLRVFEIAALRWDHFTPDLTRLVLTGKGGKLATVGIPQQLRTELLAWRDVTPDPSVVFPSVKMVGAFTPGEERLAIHWDLPLGTHGIRHVVRAAGSRAGVPNLCPHDLRRSFAGWLEEMGVGLKDISLALRHSNIATTSAYLERRPDRAAEVTAGLSIDLGVA